MGPAQGEPQHATWGRTLLFNGRALTSNVSFFMCKSPVKPGLACSCLPLLPKALSTQSRAASNRLGLSYVESLAAFPRKISVWRDWGFPAPPPSFRGPALDEMDRSHPACIPGPSESSLECRCFCREGSGASPTVGRCWVSCV